jgi:hypothetical protein
VLDDVAAEARMHVTELPAGPIASGSGRRQCGLRGVLSQTSTVRNQHGAEPAQCGSLAIREGGEKGRVEIAGRYRQGTGGGYYLGVATYTQ